MYTPINNRKIMGLLDVTKAFNCIHHKRLCNKLNEIGYSNRFIAWFRSYSCQTQITSIVDRKLSEITVLSGIAQGTVLFPLLLIFYINDIVSMISQCRILMFADDCILYMIGNAFDQMYGKLQCDLNAFIPWCTSNGLNINTDKTKVKNIILFRKLSINKIGIVI